VINGTPKIVPRAIDLCEHLVEVPSPVARFYPRNTVFAEPGREQQVKSMRPEPNRFVADVDTSLVRQIL